MWAPKHDTQGAPVPEIARFYGIIIRMYAEAGVQHHGPHFHAYYGHQEAVFSLEPIETIGGVLPLRQRRLAEAWAELHVTELSDD